MCRLETLNVDAVVYCLTATVAKHRLPHKLLEPVGYGHEDKRVLGGEELTFKLEVLGRGVALGLGV